ncbi:hypothetical protein EPO17_01015 [Patescibacteria group bacterium]|nr:MAG: hypothetical protein EPO17_01015 [Patescibacteria group bacterium]
MNSMLRNALRKNLGLRGQLEKNLLGDQGDVWEAELKKFLRKQTCWASKPKADKAKAKTAKITPPPPLVIDRTHPFDPSTFIGQGWTIWKGEASGNGLSGEEEQDKRSLIITELDASKLTKEGNFLTGLEGNESVIVGEKKLARLIVKAIQADAKIAEALYKEEGQKTLRFLYDTLGVTWMEFLGTVLRGPGGGRFALCLCRLGSGGWGWCCDWLDSGRDAGNPALGLASPLVSEAQPS